MTHLILRDMVKVKGQISEIAVLMVDKDEEISLVARSFFNELSCKGNTVYNLLPDIISRLSDTECGIEEEPFHAVMRLMFAHITKDRQTESLVEKLCQRFRTATLERQYRDLAFCLGLLPASERGLRKIQDNFDCISDKLQQDYVYQQFQNLAGRLRRALRPELKVLVDEFEQRLSRCHSRGLDEGDSIDVISGQLPKALGKRTANKKMAVSVTPRASRPNKPRHKVLVNFSSDEEEDDKEDAQDATVMDWETPVCSPIRRSGLRRGGRGIGKVSPHEQNLGRGGSSSSIRRNCQQQDGNKMEVFKPENISLRNRSEETDDCFWQGNGMGSDGLSQEPDVPGRPGHALQPARDPGWQQVLQCGGHLPQMHPL
ncbi:condensin complex subunit 1 [Rhinoraja longicauda]